MLTDIIAAEKLDTVRLVTVNGEGDEGGARRYLLGALDWMRPGCELAGIHVSPSRVALLEDRTG